MKWNASFLYQKSSSTNRDENGFLFQSGNEEFCVGGLCQVERNAPAKHIIGTDGQEFVYDYVVYTSVSYKNVLEIGDTLEIRFHNGNIVNKKIIGIDTTDRKVLAIWV
ncbi:MAG: hypothetical protein IKJ52_06995 [Muribaculaceae bacterium]|nr:hypothetical protein [Muribaculaceae bacterium]